jgi:hypothetical protein
MMRKGRIDFPEGQTDRLANIVMAGTATSNAVILRTRLDMQQVLRFLSRTLAPAID